MVDVEAEKKNPRKRNKLIRKENVLDHPYRHHIGPQQVFVKETNKWKNDLDKPKC